MVGDRTALTAEDLKKLIYMEQVIKQLATAMTNKCQLFSMSNLQVLNETFRVHPILSILLRKLHSECTISGRYYPANTEFFVS